jgi:hypothetical protein
LKTLCRSPFEDFAVIGTLPRRVPTGVSGLALRHCLTSPPLCSRICLHRKVSGIGIVLSDHGTLPFVFNNLLALFCAKSCF